MNIGDLVELSSYGKRVMRTGWVQNGDVGVIKQIKQFNFHEQYVVVWQKSGRRAARLTNAGRSKDVPQLRGTYWHWQQSFDRRDLKHARVVKRKGIDK